MSAVATYREKVKLNGYQKQHEIELVVAVVEDEATYDRFMKVLSDCGVDYVYEMEGVPKVLRYVRTYLGKVVAEAKFE